VSRPQPCTATPWLLRGLLVLLTLTGLGVWQGGHCIDDTSAHRAMSAAAISAASATTTATSAHHGDVEAAGLPSTTADTCSIGPTVVTRTTTTATPAFPTGEGTAPVVASSRPVTPCRFSPGVALTRLGISRT